MSDDDGPATTSGAAGPDGDAPDATGLPTRLEAYRRRIEELEDELRESEERYRLFVETSADGVWCLEPPDPVALDEPAAAQAARLRGEGRVRECNGPFARRVGAGSPADLLGARVEDLPRSWLHDDEDALARLAAHGYRTQVRLAREADGDGRVRLLRVSLFGVVSGARLRRVWFVEHDVTEAQADEHRLRESEEMNEAVIQTALDGICVLDGSYRILECNAAFCEMVGVDRASLLGVDARSFHTRLEPHELEAFIEAIRRSGSWRGRERLLRADGSRLDVDVASRYSPIDGGRFYCFVRDVTAEAAATDRELRHQAHLAHMTRLSTLGEMASGMAHELNQPLAAVVSYTSGAVRRLEARGEEDDELLGALRAATEQARRTGEVIRRMRSFARKNDDAMEPCSLHAIVRDVLAFLVPLLDKRGVEFVTELEADPDVVVADAIQIEQVLTNLLRNGYEACVEAGDGRVQVRTRRDRDPDGGAVVVVEVRDDGTGVPAERAGRLFAPFHTTKKDGLGLGLAISSSIVEAHGGRLWYAPAEGGGSRFQFTLPARTEEITS